MVNFYLKFLLLNKNNRYSLFSLAETLPISVFKRHLNLAIRRQLDMQIIDRSDIQEFLVIRLPAPDLTVGTEGVVVSFLFNVLIKNETFLNLYYI